LEQFWVEQNSDSNKTGNPPNCERLTRIKEQGERAPGLTRELLAFAQRQMLQPRAMDLNTVVTGLLTFLEPVIGKDEVLEVRAQPLDAIKADPITTCQPRICRWRRICRRRTAPTHLGRRVRDVLDEGKKTQPPG
jgi:hypothetical protein